MKKFIAKIVSVNNVKEGDIVAYVSNYGLVYLIAEPEDIKEDACESCFFGDSSLCTGVDDMRCYGVKYELYKGEVPKDKSICNRFKLISTDIIKSSICNENVCPYFIENCDRYIGRYSSSCIFKKIIDKHLEFNE